MGRSNSWISKQQIFIKNKVYEIQRTNQKKLRAN